MAMQNTNRGQSPGQAQVPAQVQGQSQGQTAQNQQNWGQGFGGNAAGGGGTGGQNNQMTAQMYQQYAQAMAAYGQQQGFGNWGGNMQGYGNNQGQGSGNQGNFSGGWNQGGGQWGNQQNQGPSNQMWNQNQGQGNFQGQGGGGGMNQKGMNQQGWGNNNMRNQGGGRGGGGGGGGGGGNFNRNQQQGQWDNSGNQNSGGNWGNQNRGGNQGGGGGNQGGGNQNQMDGGDDDWDGDSTDEPQRKKHRGGQKVRMRRIQQAQDRQQNQNQQGGGGNQQGQGGGGNQQGGFGGGGGGGQQGPPNKRKRDDGGNHGRGGQSWGKGKQQRGGGKGGKQGHQADQWGDGGQADAQNLQSKLTAICERIAKKLEFANSDEDKFDYLEEFIKAAADVNGESPYKFETILNKLNLMSTLVFKRDLNNSSVCRFYINDIYIAQGFGLNLTKAKANAYAMSDDVFKERNWRTKLVCDQKLRQDTFRYDDIDITFMHYPEEHRTIESTQFNCWEQVATEWSKMILLEKTGVFQGANGILKQSAEFNKMVLEYDYMEPEKSVCKCKILLQNSVVAEAEKTKRNKAKSAASHLALDKIRKTNWTIKIIRTEFPVCGNIVRRKAPMVVLPAEEGEENKDAVEPKMSLDEFLKQDGDDKGKEAKDKEAPAVVEQAKLGEEEVEDESGFTPPKAHITPPDVYTGDEMSVREVKFYTWAAPQTALDKMATLIEEYKAKDSIDDLILSGFNTDERFNIINYCKYLGLACIAKRWYEDMYLFISQVFDPQVLLDRIMALGGKTEKYELIPPKGDEEEADDGLAEAKAAMAYVPEQTNANGAAETKVAPKTEKK